MQSPGEVHSGGIPVPVSNETPSVRASALASALASVLVSEGKVAVDDNVSSEQAVSATTIITSIPWATR